MEARIKQLREQSVRAAPTISAERALLLTESYQSPESQRAATPVQRALAFKHIMSHKELYVGDGELIVGERGPRPLAVPTYPEVCVHSLEDLEILDTREKIPYRVDEDVKQAYRSTVLPFWHGRSQRERLLGEMTPEWLDAYEAGMQQVADRPFMLHCGPSTLHDSACSI